LANKRKGSAAVREAEASEAVHALVEPALYEAMEWRLIGPHRGGRVVAVAGDPANPQVFYFGSTGGGVWKTTDGGVYWENISDGFFKRASVGAIAVAPSDPNVIYVGMGEATIRGNVSHGDGVYKSTDGGKTWRHLGLAETRNIGKVRVHPQNPEVVYVAALGHAHGPNKERGVYRTRDGGQTWEQVLARGEKAGAIDLSLDPNNPRILYAAFWEAIRGPYYLTSGGPGSGLFKSSDGGDTWTDISHNEGLPKGGLGKIGVAVSPAKEDRVYAVVEAEDGAVFRSDDGGAHWQRLSEERSLRQRAWYYHHIIADPRDADTVWVLNVQCWRSLDGGKTFAEVPMPHGDNHDLWIDPRDPRRMIEGNDGGATISFNGGETWSSIYSQPTAEFYHVITDTRSPYRVYGAQQDNTTISVASRSHHSGITRADWEEVGGGESGYIAVRPDDPNVIFAGNYFGYLTRYDTRTGQARNVTVWPEALTGHGAKDAKYRFQWTYPIVLSPHDPSVLYATSNHVHRSTDEGASWEVISPDLTRNDVSKQEASGGPITKDNTGAEFYCTIFAFAESPVQRGVLWAGSDDGQIHVSRDGGKSWQNVTPKAKLLPEWSLISLIEPSPHDPATAYVAANRYKLDDFQPLLFRTHDYGQTWTKITNGLPGDVFTRAIREDPERAGLLFVGTETGIYVSFDDGEHWQSLQLNLPVVPVHDLVIEESDLVVATHGRSFWILDDITPLRQLREAVPAGKVHLYQPRPAIRYTLGGWGGPPSEGKYYDMTGPFMVTSRPVLNRRGEKEYRPLDAGQNPPDGAVVLYYLKDQPEEEVALTFLDARGNELRTFTSKEPEPPTTSTRGQDVKEEEEKKEPRVPKEAGANRFVWNLRLPDPKKVDGYVASEAAMSGPRVPPGTYRARLTVGKTVQEQTFQVVKDSRLPTTQEEFDRQFELLQRIAAKVSETHDAINTLRSIRQQVEEWERRAKGQSGEEAVRKAAEPLKEQLTAIEDELIQSKAKSRQDTLNFPVRLNAQLAGLAGVVGSADAAPTRQSYELFEEISRQIDARLQRLQKVIAKEVDAFNQAVRAASLPAIVPSTERVKVK
jgi:photosystem II stability/assembly factor-like uncharacterized protein